MLVVADRRSRPTYRGKAKLSGELAGRLHGLVRGAEEPRVKTRRCLNEAFDLADATDRSAIVLDTTKVGVGDGSDLATAADVGVALYWGPGVIKTAFLPAFSGTTDGELDANASTDLAHFIRFED